MTYKPSIMLSTNKRANPDLKRAASAAPALPQVTDYADFREFLADWFEAKKKLTPSYSGAVFARQAGLSAHTLLGMVIRNQRNLRYETIRAFIQALSLEGRDALYFEKLVLFNQAKKPKEKAYHLDQLHSISRGEGRKLVTRIRNHANYLNRWYVVAIRELVTTEGFRPDPAWIAARLKNKITRKEAREGWELLLELGLVEKRENPDGSFRYEVVHPALDIDPGHVDFALRDFHRDYLNRALHALDQESLEERELSSLTLPVTEEDLPRVRERVKEFRRKLNLEFPLSKDLPRKHVIAVNTQLLVLTDLSKGETK